MVTAPQPVKSKYPMLTIVLTLLLLVTIITFAVGQNWLERLGNAIAILLGLKNQVDVANERWDKAKKALAQQFSFWKQKPMEP